MRNPSKWDEVPITFLNNPVFVPNDLVLEPICFPVSGAFGRDQAHPPVLWSLCSVLLSCVKISVFASLMVFRHISYLFLLFSKLNKSSSVIISAVACNKEMILLGLLSESPWPLTKPLPSSLPTPAHSIHLRNQCSVNHHQLYSCPSKPHKYLVALPKCSVNWKFSKDRLPSLP